ncbi:MAG TPA: PQQ-binding-like beta-propeller repeat protein [Tepidisphaeraceae bacterium]|nr:PQQ-binding-like beta-propeller repeat protein [Tepidisphaeraceae bacterium]
MLCSTLNLAQMAWTADQPQWGQRYSRNMVSDEKGLPDSFASNVKWSAALGDQSYGTPIVAGGKVLIGTNNERPRDARHQGDRGVLMCFDEKDGHLCWQLVVPKMEDDPYLDWPKVGMASTPTVEGNRVYTLTNRGEVVCLDLNGMADGNDGPFRDEGRHMTPRGQPLMEPGPLDADIIWICDLVKEAGVHIHDQVEGSVLIDGDYLYVNSNNGVDNTHRRIRSPNAPSLVVLDKRTGRIVAWDDEHIGPHIFHSTWSSPSLGVVNGRRLIFFGGCDGVCYAFDAFAPTGGAGSPAMLPDVWKFDCDPAGPKGDIHRFISNRRDGPSEILGMPAFFENRVYVVAGGDLWWGKRKSWLKCIDATKAGDVTKTAEVWSCPLGRESCSTPAVYDGLVFVSDCGGVVHCIDAITGQPVWTYKADGGFWASPMIADGKLYIGTRAGEFDVLAATREKRLISSTQVGDPISATITAANGSLYLATMTHLYALSRNK